MNFDKLLENKPIVAESYAPDFWSVAKSIGILSVVVGHVLFAARRLSIANAIMDFVFLYHLVIFFFISGYFYKEEYTQKDFLIKRLKSLWVPFVSYGVVFIFLQPQLKALNLHSYIDSIYDWQEKLDKTYQAFAFNITEFLLMPIWFLPCLFIALFIYDGLRRVADKLIFKRKNLTLAVLISLCVCFSYLLDQYDIHFPIYGSPACLILPILWLGDNMKGYINKKIFSIFFLLISFVILVACVYVFRVKVDLRLNIAPMPILFYIISILGIYFVLALSYYLMKIHFLSRLLTLIGQESLHIMILHMPIMYLISWLSAGVVNTPLSWLMLLSIQFIVGVFLPILWISLFRIVKMKMQILIDKYLIDNRG